MLEAGRLSFIALHSIRKNELEILTILWDRSFLLGVFHVSLVKLKSKIFHNSLYKQL